MGTKKSKDGSDGAPGGDLPRTGDESVAAIRDILVGRDMAELRERLAQLESRVDARLEELRAEGASSLKALAAELSSEQEGRERALEDLADRLSGTAARLDEEVARVAAAGTDARLHLARLLRDVAAGLEDEPRAER